MTDTLSSAVSAATSAAIRAAEASTGGNIRAPDNSKTYVSVDEADNVLTVEGLPEVYDAKIIEKYWKSQGSALQQRWSEFLRLAVPYITRVSTLMLTGGMEALEREAGPLARDARKNMEQLGPTYIKLGQMLSVRPDVLPPAALDELQRLQDNVPTFPTETAMEVLAQELGRPIDEVFSEVSAEPVAAASLAQVYKGTLRATGETVAIKVQRPNVLEMVTKDLYVLRRAAEVYQNLMERFAPQQRTDYVAILNEWAIGFYTELDFQNEGRNQRRISELLEREGVTTVLVPRVLEEYSTRRLLVSEWVEGVKLSECAQEDIASLVGVGQEAFLVQLLQFGVFHADPHPGNLMMLPPGREDGKRLAILDFGLVATVKQEDRDTMVSALIHFANKDYTSLFDDFVDLGILPPETSRGLVLPLMDKALTPYIQGGGAKKYAAAVSANYGMDGTTTGGGFQAMTQDLLTVLNEVPFTIPPYFALLARAMVTLEGIALQGNPDYAIVLETYPFIARKLLKDDRPEVQRALQQALYGSGPGTGDGGMRGNRLAVLLNSALGVVERSGSGGAVDLDRMPTEFVEAGTALRYVLSDDAASLRDLLKSEGSVAADLVLRQTLRRGMGAFDGAFAAALRPVPFGAQLFASPLDVPTPVPLPLADGTWSPPRFLTPRELVDAAAPPLDRKEELYLLSLADLAGEVLGPNAKAIVNGDAASSDALAVPRLVVDASESYARAHPGTPEAQQAQSLARALRAFIDGPQSLLSRRAPLRPPAGVEAAHAAADRHESSLDSLVRAAANLTQEEEEVLQGMLRNTVNDAVQAALERISRL
eukprot:CAMPEP_0206011302 /NCGR_PEP_ID=MMETSP1464-20131121/13028_1 /ASSEMBLY_ACC=CAM_ASM_001124 /TAXON_ID=119497 /ORGANISM="Exanthemachrysis gayraliae, Strain RCC1523" /LENGTH=821 /DNA_ID=CAMNT_0053384957 /DNA_START=58 /DNA_END=2523 /DNA_ORIENTATION=+